LTIFGGDIGMMLELLDPGVRDKLKQYGIGEDDFKLKMGRYHTVGREGVPYRMLIIRKNISGEKQTALEMELRTLDESLCVIFKNFRK
jgi:hypothetical protein